MTDLTDYVTVIEAADELGVHPETVKRLCRQGDIQAIKFRNAWLIRRETLDAFAREYSPGRGPGSRFRRIQEEAVRYLPRQLKFDAGDEDR